MANVLGWLFSCCASTEAADARPPASAPSAPSATTPAPAKKDRPAPNAAPARPNNTNAALAKQSTLHGDEPVFPIPLEFMNPEVEVPEEVAMKGRRQSTGTLLNPAPGISPGVDHARQPEDSPRPSSYSGSQVSGHSGFASLPDAISGDTVDAVPQSPIGGSNNHRFQSLLGAQAPVVAGRKCLVLDLDETLVHSSFKALDYADFIIRVEIEEIVHDVYVVKRPGIDEFLAAVSQLFEVVVFTASVAKYGDPLLDRLDPLRRVHHRLFRESCYNYNGNYIKDLAQLGRPLEDVIIIDNSPGSYALQPNNAVPVSSWFSDMHDNELLDMLPLLEDLAGPKVPDVSVVLQASW